MTRNTQAIPTKPHIPLFYKDPVLLRFEDHRDAELAPVPGFGFAREAVAIPLCIGDFAVAMRHYSIVFAIDDNASPIALVAVKPIIICSSSAMARGAKADRAGRQWRVGTQPLSPAARL